MRQQTGITLFEVLTTLVVAGVLIAVGVPAYQSWVGKSREVTRSNAFASALNLARTEAVKRGATVMVCPDSDATDGRFVCGDSDDWDEGWIVFMDANANNAIDNNDTETPPIRFWPAFDPRATVSVAESDGTAVASIGFDASGSTLGKEILYTSLTQASSSSDKRQCLALSAVGSVRTFSTTTDANCYD